MPGGSNRFRTAWTFLSAPWKLNNEECDESLESGVCGIRTLYDPGNCRWGTQGSDRRKTLSVGWSRNQYCRCDHGSVADLEYSMADSLGKGNTWRLEGIFSQKASYNDIRKTSCERGNRKVILGYIVCFLGGLLIIKIIMCLLQIKRWFVREVERPLFFVYQESVFMIYKKYSV